MQEQNNDSLETIKSLIRDLSRVEQHLLNGQVIYAYRAIMAAIGQYGPYLFASKQSNQIHRVASFLKRGEQVDAHNGLKGLININENKVERLAGQEQGG